MGRLKPTFCLFALFSDSVALPGPYQGLTRGLAKNAVLNKLKTLGQYRGGVEQEEEVLRSRFGDIVNVRDVRDINLRKPILILSTSQDGPNVSLSSNINMEACEK